MDSATASRKFFEALLKIPGWESMPVTVAAQSVQNSMYPDYYADDEPIARQLHAQFKGAGANLTPAELASITEGGAITVADGGSSSCGDPCPVPARVAGGSGPSSDFGRAVIEAASRWIGTPYVWGGGDQNGPTDGGFDCSGLTLYAIYQASGGRISLPHFTGSNANPGQLNDASGQEVQFSAKQPGDLIFFGPASETHHVGIYYGVKDGQEMLLHAPQSGETVTIARSRGCPTNRCTSADSAARPPREGDPMTPPSSPATLVDRGPQCWSPPWPLHWPPQDAATTARQTRRWIPVARQPR
ncbi:hypothetical protein GS898_17850 [Rhodococcus hoagii]|nr:hypothetical protein [Prescottella equi]